jgi:hypothetical protein
MAYLGCLGGGFRDRGVGVGSDEQILDKVNLKQMHVTLAPSFRSQFSRPGALRRTDPRSSRGGTRGVAPQHYARAPWM